MAESIHVAGSTKLKLAGNVVGQTDENNDISLQMMPGEKIIRTNESGPHMDAKVINLGIVGLLRVPLISWDQTQVDTLVARGAAAEAQVGTLGADITLSSITITTTKSGEYSYTFPKSRIVDNYTIEKFGYEAERLVLVFRCIPDPSALTTPTTAVFTKAAN